MKPIRVISTQFELLGEIDDYESFILTRRFYSYGEFELHVNINKNNVDALQKNNIIMLSADGHKTGIIKHSEINLDENGNGKETLTVKGFMLDGLLIQRITLPDATGYDRVIGNAETVMKHYVNTNCISPTNVKRIIPNLINASDQARGINTPWQTRYENLADVLQQIAEFCDVGWEVFLDIQNNKYKFDLIPGRNLTASQDILPPVIFSTEFDNIASQKYVESDMGYKNVGYAGGKGEEENRLIQQVGDGEGLDRYETFLDLSNSEDATELINNGNQALSQLKKVQSIENSVLQNSSFIYGVDWDLGDIVTVQNKKWGVTLDTRITEIKEIYEPGNIRIDVVFGNDLPTLTQKLKKHLNKPIR